VVTRGRAKRQGPARQEVEGGRTAGPGGEHQFERGGGRRKKARLDNCPPCGQKTEEMTCIGGEQATNRGCARRVVNRLQGNETYREKAGRRWDCPGTSTGEVTSNGQMFEYWGTGSKVEPGIGMQNSAMPWIVEHPRTEAAAKEASDTICQWEPKAAGDPMINYVHESTGKSSKVSGGKKKKTKWPLKLLSGLLKEGSDESTRIDRSGGEDTSTRTQQLQARDLPWKYHIKAQGGLKRTT